MFLSSSAPPLTAVKPTFQEVFHAYGRYVVRVLRHLGVREADVQDACQEVFTVVYRRLSSLESEAALPSWIYAIAWRVARDCRRRGKRKPEELSETLPETLATENSEDLVHRRQQREMLLSILDQLDENRREIFVLYELGELPMAEIATIVGCPLQTAYARLHAARKDIEEIVRREKARGKFQ